jgi:hypothetical protein
LLRRRERRKRSGRGSMRRKGSRKKRKGRD